ncbi:hypothetical protein TOPH_02551 [Tolypocladium ophioglossoides CBS 100239]|uniref:Uncharacterized protein n=1 Tax=Tolypocladium ophioglossoides (strain CBS 100239) TaxID=1163406 RepID=A0A0L0NFM9_TOLOC|nr:hypothetical protein TOPH_02551 [Tolypocladium ophioglossoides CBS 100239]
MHQSDDGPTPELAPNPFVRPRPSAAASTRCTPGNDLQPWTAARCHRLLRQLQSRLAGLRKLAMEDRDMTSRQPKRPCPADSEPNASKRIRFTYGGRRQHTVAAALKPAAAKTPPRTIRTLGAMKLGRSSPASGQVDIPTPIWRKIREQPDTPLPARESPSSLVPNDILETTSLDLLREMRSLRQAVTDERYRIYEAVFGWLNGLLRSTMSEVCEPHRNSLLGMCLRKVPACVANIEAYERQAAKEQCRQSMWDASNVSFELYGQLEALGPSSSGWRPLKLAVRSHAMSLLSQAISKGLFEPPYVGLLTRLCLHLSCTDEANRLAKSVDTLLPGPGGTRSNLTESTRLLPLRHVLESSNGRRVPGEALSCVSTLVQRGLLPVSWLSTQSFASLWASSLEVMTARKSGTSVTAFMSTCLPLLALGDRGKPSTQQPGNTNQTLISVAAGLVAAAIAVTTAHSTNKEQKRKRAWRHVIFVLDLCVAEVRQYRRQQGEHDNGLFIFALARHLAMVDASFASLAFRRQVRIELQGLVAKAGSSASSQLHYRQMILLLCSVAQHRSRSCGMPGRDSVTESCAKLDGLDLGGSFGRGLRTDVAFLLAQRTKDLRDLAFAESLPSVEESPRVSTIFSGWRWEEGISEWVLPSHEGDGKADQVGMESPLEAAESSEGDDIDSEDAERECQADDLQRERKRSPGCTRDLVWEEKLSRGLKVPSTVRKRAQAAARGGRLGRLGMMNACVEDMALCHHYGVWFWLLSVESLLP